ncbi:threonine/homoserine efflux transporter RhtA [Fontibacillus phaseoli]|uniref:Threonine/homoserine efflux transporter RhtA n=1 Tax=Fontibacillus phaseoli TaxID=1416533 RepID=A0A369BSG5_9BACL|nr:DMT family transporter [Fontibacillus phaseoli]RCX22544.1 threonine/homoserine efflux transporter RhtA [Fontibacillus phaseoli]
MKFWHYALIVFLGGCCYGILSTFVKLAYAAGFTVSVVTGGQYFFGVVLAWLAVLFTKKKKLTSLQISKLILSGIPFGLTGIFYYQALQTLNASLAIVFLFQFVWIGALLEWVFHKKKPTKSKLISIVMLLIGSILAANLLFQERMALSWQGSIWGLLAALSFSSFVFLSSFVEKEAPPILKSALLSTGGVITVFIAFPPTFLFDLEVLMGVIPYGLVLGIFGVVLPPLLFSIGMPHVGSGLGTILTASELPVVVTMSSLVLAEPISLPQWIGVIVILGGIINGNIRSGNSNKKALNIQKAAG